MAMSMGSWSYPTKYLAWEATDNCKSSTYPLKIYRYIPATFSSIESATLQFSIEKFRSYETTTIANSAPGASYAVNSVVAFNIATADTWTDTDFTWSVSSNTLSINVGLEVLYTDTVFGDELFVRVKNTTNSTYYPNSGGINYFFGAIPDGTFDSTWFSVEIPGNFNGKSFMVQVMQEDVATMAGYLSGVATMVGTHTHGMTYDIYEASYSNPSISIKINDTDRTTALGGPWTSDQNAINIADYLNIGEWNKIELVPNQLLRINTSVLVVGIE